MYIIHDEMWQSVLHGFWNVPRWTVGMNATMTFKIPSLYKLFVYELKFIFGWDGLCRKPIQAVNNDLSGYVYRWFKIHCQLSALRSTKKLGWLSSVCPVSPGADTIDLCDSAMTQRTPWRRLRLRREQHHSVPHLSIVVVVSTRTLITIHKPPSEG